LSGGLAGWNEVPLRGANLDAGALVGVQVGIERLERMGEAAEEQKLLHGGLRELVGLLHRHGCRIPLRLHCATEIRLAPRRPAMVHENFALIFVCNSILPGDPTCAAMSHFARLSASVSRPPLFATWAIPKPAKDIVAGVALSHWSRI
jgi:hypothetical protein